SKAQQILLHDQHLALVLQERLAFRLYLRRGKGEREPQARWLWEVLWGVQRRLHTHFLIHRPPATKVHQVGQQRGMKRRIPLFQLMEDLPDKKIRGTVIRMSVAHMGSNHEGRVEMAKDPGDLSLQILAVILDVR